MVKGWVAGVAPAVPLLAPGGWGLFQRLGWGKRSMFMFAPRGRTFHGFVCPSLAALGAEWPSLSNTRPTVLVYGGSVLHAGPAIVHGLWTWYEGMDHSFSGRFLLVSGMLERWCLFSCYDFAAICIEAFNFAGY